MKTAEDTEAWGRQLAGARPAAGEPLAVIYLQGDLGAGKTTFARGFLRGCGVSGAVRSPTYTLAQLYESGSQLLVHLDLYRLRDASELEHLGLSEWARPGCLWLIEWPQRGGTLLPPADLIVALEAGSGGHEARLTAATAAGAAWVSRLPADSFAGPQTPRS